MAKKTKFVYRGKERTSEEVSRNARQTSGAFDRFLVEGIPSIKVTEGDHTYRVLPASWDTEPGSDARERWGTGWSIEIWLHWKVGPQESTFLCLEKMKNEPCPICDARGDAETKKEMDALRPTRSNLCWAVDRDDTKSGPQILRIAPKYFSDINGRLQDKKTQELILIDDPEDGYDFSFEGKKNGDFIEWSQISIDREPSPLHEKEAIQNKWIEFAMENPLPEILHYADPEYMEKVLQGKAVKDEDEEDEDDTEAKGSRSRGRSRDKDEEEDERPARRKARREADEEDEEEEEEKPRLSSRSRAEPEEEEDEEEDEKPRGRKKPRRDADEDEEEEEDEEEKPKSSRRATTAEKRTRKPKDEEPEEEDEDDEPSESKRARDKLKKLKAKKEEEAEEDEGEEEEKEERTSSRRRR